MLNSSLQISASPLPLPQVSQAQPWGTAQPHPLQMHNVLHLGTQPPATQGGTTAGY